MFKKKKGKKGLSCLPNENLFENVNIHFMENICMFLNDGSCCLVDNITKRCRLLFDLSLALLPHRSRPVQLNITLPLIQPQVRRVA